MVDPCVFRLMVKDEVVVAMFVVHVDDIKIAATKEITDSVVADLNRRFPTKHLGEVTWYMGSAYRRDRKKGTLKISQTQFEMLSNALVSQKTAAFPLLRRWTSDT